MNVHWSVYCVYLKVHTIVECGSNHACRRMPENATDAPVYQGTLGITGTFYEQTVYITVPDAITWFLLQNEEINLFI